MVHILIEKAVVLRSGVRMRVVSNPDIKFVDCERGHREIPIAGDRYGIVDKTLALVYGLGW